MTNPGGIEPYVLTGGWGATNRTLGLTKAHAMRKFVLAPATQISNSCYCSNGANTILPSRGLSVVAAYSLIASHGPRGASVHAS